MDAKTPPSNPEGARPGRSLALAFSKAPRARHNTLTDKQIPSATTKLFCKKSRYTLMGFNNRRYAVKRESSQPVQLGIVSAI
jgi:hypothetical protein